MAPEKRRTNFFDARRSSCFQTKVIVAELHGDFEHLGAEVARLRGLLAGSRGSGPICLHPRLSVLP